MSFFDDDIFQENSIEDILEEIGNSITCLHPASYYRERGTIGKGDSIMVETKQGDEEIDGKKNLFTLQGWCDAMIVLHGKSWRCHASVDAFDPTRYTTLIYECLPYAEKEMDAILAKEINLEGEKGDWLISINTHDESLSFDFLADIILNCKEGQIINVYSCYSVNDPKATSFSEEETFVKCLGVYALDRKKNLYYRRFIYRKYSSTVRLS